MDNEVYELGYPTNPELLGVLLAHCGYEVRTENYYNNGLTAGFFRHLIWQYTLSGEGELRIAGNRYRLRSGDAMVLQRPENHSYYLPKDSQRWEFIFIAIYGSEAMRLFELFRDKCGPVVHHAENSPMVACAQEILARCRAGIRFSRYESSRFAYNFLMELFAESDLLSPVAAPRLPLAEIHNYCRQHIQDMVTVEQLAEIAGLSRCHFSRRFIAEVGLSPHIFLLRMRLQLALRLLESSDLTLKEIALRCGFRDQSYLCRIFRKKFGQTPNVHRIDSRNRGRNSASDEWPQSPLN